MIHACTRIYRDHYTQSPARIFSRKSYILIYTQAGIYKNWYVHYPLQADLYEIDSSILPCIHIHMKTDQNNLPAIT